MKIVEHEVDLSGKRLQVLSQGLQVSNSGLCGFMFFHQHGALFVDIADKGYDLLDGFIGQGIGKKNFPG